MAEVLGFRCVVLIVDYAQRVPIRTLGVAGEPNELQRIDHVMRGLKGIALRFGVPVLASSIASNLHRTPQNAGLGSDGNHSLIKALERLAGLEVGPV